jgi:hypothetical protein
MTKFMRYVLLVVAALQLFFALAFFLQWPIAVNIWPFPGTTPLTFIFIASIAAAAGASTLWAAATENFGALGGIGLDYIAILLPVSILSFQIAAGGGNPTLAGYGVLCLTGVLFGVGIFVWSLRFPMDRTLPMPGLVRWSFVVFIVALLITSGRLILQIPTIPWAITPDLGVVIAAIFFGAALYFVYGLARPSWVNSAGQLVGFLAYDLVLIVPFLTRLPTVAAEHRLGLTIYTGVVLYSGLVAIYYLFINGPTRLWGRKPAATAATP